MPLTLLADRQSLSVSEANRRFILVSAEAAPGGGRLPVSLAIVIGGFDGHHLDPACGTGAALAAIANLRAGDRISIVGEEMDALFPSTEVTPPVLLAAEAFVKQLRHGPPSDLFRAWLRGCVQAASKLEGRMQARCLVIADKCDAVAFEPSVTQSEWGGHASALFDRGVTTCTLASAASGHTLRIVSMLGGGLFRLLEDNEPTDESVSALIGHGLQAPMEDAILEFEAPLGVRLTCLEPLPVTFARRRWQVALGTLPPGASRKVLIQVELGPVGLGKSVEIRGRIRNQHGELATYEFAVFTGKVTDPSEKSNPVVLGHLAVLHAKNAQAKVAELLQREQRNEAQILLLEAALSLRIWARDVPEIDMTTLAEKLELEAEACEKRGAGPAAAGTSPMTGQVTLTLCPTDEMTGRLIAQAAAILGPRHQEQLRSEISDCVRAWFPAEQPVRQMTRAEEKAMVAAAATGSDGNVRIVFVRHQLFNNWFSHWHEEQRVVVVSVFGWEQLSDVSTEAFVAHEIVIHSLHARHPEFNSYKMYHLETRGCWGDFCQNRAEMEIKLQTGHLCAACIASLTGYGFDLAGLMPMLETVREMAHVPARQTQPGASR